MEIIKKNIFQNNKWLLAIVFVAFSVRVIYFLSVKPWESSFFEQKSDKVDSEEYHILAKMIVENGCYPENIYLDTYRTPVFPMYIALFYFLFGIKPYVVLITHILLNLISIIFIFLITEKIFNNKTVSLIASFLYAFEPNIVKLVAEFGTETLHATLLIISVYYLIAGLKDKKNIYIIVSGVFFGITVLTRPISFYFYFLCILFIFFFPYEKRKIKYKYVLLFITFYFISIAPWMYRNYKVYDHYSTNTFQGNAMMYYAEITKCYETGIPFDSVNKEYLNVLNKICEENRIKNPFDVDKQKGILGFNYIIQHLDVYIPLHLKGMLKFFIAPLNNEKYSYMSKIILASYFLIIYTSFLVGNYGMIKEKKHYYIISFNVLIFYFSFLTGIIGRARYRLPTTAFYLIIIAYGIYYITNKYKERLAKNKI